MYDTDAIRGDSASGQTNHGVGRERKLRARGFRRIARFETRFSKRAPRREIRVRIQCAAYTYLGNNNNRKTGSYTCTFTSALRPRLYRDDRPLSAHHLGTYSSVQFAPRLSSWSLLSSRWPPVCGRWKSGPAPHMANGACQQRT